MRRLIAFALAGALVLPWGTASVSAQAVSGSTAEERAVNGARAYLKRKGLQGLKLNMLLSPLFLQAVRDNAAEFEKLTGIGLGKFIEVGILNVGQKLLAEAVGKTGGFDLMVAGATDLPDAAAAGVLMPLDDLIARGRPDLDLVIPNLLSQSRFRGETFGFFADGDNFILLIRKDWIEKSGEKEAFRKKYGWTPGCPRTWKQWEQLAEHFTRDTNGDGRPDFYGAMGYRSRRWGWRWWLNRFYSRDRVPFDRDFNPTIDNADGLAVTREYISLTKYMPKDILGWATPQAYPFFAQGNAFSIYTFPSISLAAGHPEKSKVRGKVEHCLPPGSEVSGRLVRRSLQGFGNLFLINRHSAHGEAAYWLIQWLTSRRVGTRLVANPQSVFDPFMAVQFDDPSVIEARSREFTEVQKLSSQIMVPMLLVEGAAEYAESLDKNINKALLGQMTPEDALKETEREWRRITRKIGRPAQVKAWRGLLDGMPKVDEPR